MKSIKKIFGTLCATLSVLTFSQCYNAQQSPVVTQVVCDSMPTLRIAYVDIDTLLTSYNLWIELNEDMIRKEENVRATLNEKAKDLQTDYEDFERKLNNNAFVTRERAEAEQNRIPCSFSCRICCNSAYGTAFRSCHPLYLPAGNPAADPPHGADSPVYRDMAA